MNDTFNWKKQIILFLSAQTISLFGSSIVQYAIIWHITLSTSSGLMLMISTLCGFLPQIAVSLFAGVLIDRFDRRKVIILADAMIALSTLIVAICFLLGYSHLWLLFMVLFIRSLGAGVQTPAVNAFIPQIVPTEKLMKINGINSSLNSLMMFLSPAASGAFLALAGITATFFVDVVTAIISISIMWIIKAKTYLNTTGGNSYLTDIREGFNYLFHHSFIRQLLLFQIIVLILISPSAFLTPLMVARSFGAEIWRLTASEMTFSAGAVLGGILIAIWGGFQKRFHTVIMAGCLYGFLMISLGLSPIFIIYLLFNVLIGITMPLYNAPLTVLIQEEVPAAMHGRVFSFLQISTSCALPLGMVIFGPLADTTSVQILLISCGTFTIITTVLFFFKTKRSK